jgi:hypothetical protein
MTARHRITLLCLSLLPALLAAAAVLAAAPAPDDEEGFDVVELIPEDKAGFTATHIFAPLTGLFHGGPGYWYGDRQLRIVTTPPGAMLDLFYVRKNFQKGYEQADAPAIVKLPSRIEAGDRDSVTIRAFLDGYKQREISVRVRGKEENIDIVLEPLANRLVAASHLYFGGRSSLTFLTKEALTFRVQNREGGYSVILVETGGTEEAAASLETVSDPFIHRVRSQQLGEDLVVMIELTKDAIARKVDLRQSQTQDPIRRLHKFTLSLIPPGGDAVAVKRTREALARIGYGRVSGCAVRFDGEMHQQLDMSALSRALTPSSSFIDPYLRAAMKRLGEISPGGAVTLGDGTQFRTSIPIELSAATSQAAEVHGYIAMLRALVAELEPPGSRRQTLRGLIAPEMPPAAFDAAFGAAEQAERACLASAR